MVKGVVSQEERHVQRVLRTIPTLRTTINSNVLANVAVKALKGMNLRSRIYPSKPPSGSDSAYILQYVSSEGMDASLEGKGTEEAFIFTAMLLLIHLIDQHTYDKVRVRYRSICPSISLRLLKLPSHSMRAYITTRTTPLTTYAPSLLCLAKLAFNLSNSPISPVFDAENSNTAS